MPELSIIVPVYNVEPFLSRCIDSILAQQYKNYELILVNDGSTDLSGDIIERYATRDKRIIPISQPNRGVSSARNSGLQVATGKYVSFIDADDWIEEEMYSTLIRCMKKNDVDLVCCNWSRNYEDGTEKEHPVHLDEGIMTTEKFVCHIFDSPRSIGGSIWNKIFLREKIGCLFDESIRVCEDNLFLLQYCSGISKSSYINTAYYHIYERSNSATRSGELKYTEVLPVREKLIIIAGEIGASARNAAESDYLDQCYHYQNNCNIYKSRDLKNIIRDYSRNHIREIIFNDYIPWKLKIRYFLT